MFHVLFLFDQAGFFYPYFRPQGVKNYNKMPRSFKICLVRSEYEAVKMKYRSSYIFLGGAPPATPLRLGLSPRPRVFAVASTAYWVNKQVYKNEYK